MKCFAILLQTEFCVGGKKLFDLGKATEESKGKRIKVYAKFDREREKDRQEVEVRNKTKNRDARGPAHVTDVKKKKKTGRRRARAS